MLKKLLTILCILPIQANANIGPADILGRDLDIPGLGSLGHVALAYGNTYPSTSTEVIEVLNESPVIQINTIENFKSKTKYWGSRWIITGVTRSTDAMNVIHEGITQQGFCPIYTSTAQYKAGTPDSCAIFRCDTFVYHLFNAGTGCKLIKEDGSMFPSEIYKAFPNSNGDEPHSTLRPTIELRSMTPQKLSAMNLKEFMEIINSPIDKITDEEINRTWQFSRDYSLSSEKRTLLLDKLGFIGRMDMLPAFIDEYFKMNDPNIKSMLLRSTLTIYQKYYADLVRYPKEKDILQKFYMRLLDTHLSKFDSSIAIRGFVQLSNSEVILANINTINNIFNNQEINLDPFTCIGLMLELAFKSKNLERIYIPNMINILKSENNPQIDNLFNQFIIRKLSNSGLDSLEWESKNAIHMYLDSVKYKYDPLNNGKIESNVFSLFYGSWLEAIALVSSKSLDEAGQYIANFLKIKSPSEQLLYVNGFSNSDYMTKAFNKYQILINLKNNYKTINSNVLDTPWWCTPA